MWKVVFELKKWNYYPKLSFIFKIYLILCFECWLHVCVCTIYMLGTLRGHKVIQDPQELELDMVVSHHSGARNWTWVLLYIYLSRKTTHQTCSAWCDQNLQCRGLHWAKLLVPVTWLYSGWCDQGCSGRSRLRSVYFYLFGGIIALIKFYFFLRNDLTLGQS